jgi:hypothetical protein
MPMVSVPVADDLNASLEERSRAAGFENLGDYIAALLRAGIGTPVDAETERLLLEGLESPAREVTRADWDEKVRRFNERMARGEDR